MDLNSRVWNQASTLVLTGLTTLMMTLTIFFAYNSSAEHPLTHKLIFANPSTNILVLNVLSQLAIFCLSELTTWVFAAVRWSFASSLSGIPAFTFLVLSRATNPLGVLALLLGRNDPGFSRDSHRFWGGQRIFFLILRGVLGVLLLSDVSFTSTYPQVYTYSIEQAGLAPLNASIIDTANFNLTATAEFWWYFPALLTDIKRVKPVAPLVCTGPSCNSYFIPGSMSSIVLDPTQKVVTGNDYPGALASIQDNAPGYQLDFYPIDTVDDPYMTLDDCQLYGVDFLAVQVCLKEAPGGSMLAAWSSCPNNVRGNSSCLNTTDWRLTLPLNTKLTISERRASTVFDRFNFTITDIIDISDPTPTNYTAQDFFAFYDIIFNVDQTQTNWPQSIQYMFLLGIAIFLSDPSPIQNQTGVDDRLSRLEEFLATPIFLFNNAVFGGPIDGLGKSITLANRSYRLVIAPHTIYLFFVGGFLTLLWCFIILLVSLRINSPNTSFYPEIDIASKITGGDDSDDVPMHDHPSTISQLLSPLNNSGSIAIMKQLRGFRFFARRSDSEYQVSGRVILVLEDNGITLKKHENGMEPARNTEYWTKHLD